MANSNAAASTPIIDPAAGRLLTAAVKAENEHRYVAAYNLYTEGIQILFDSIKICRDAALKSTLTGKATAYLERAEQLKKIVENEKQKPMGYHEQICIDEGDTGFGYDKVFCNYIDVQLTEVEIDDPYIRINHQLQLFVRFCGVLVKYGRNLKTIRLKTSRDSNSDNRDKQMQRLEEIRLGLLKRRIHLFIEYCDNLHDREIRFSNGWIIKIGRGLDYFKKPDGPNSVDNFELDLRPCLATTIDLIFKPQK